MAEPSGDAVARFDFPPVGGWPVRLCLESAGWCARVVQANPTPGQLADAAGRLADAVRAAADVIGDDSPTLLPARGLLDLIVHAVTGRPPDAPPIADLAAELRAAPAAAVARLANPGYAHRVRAFERAADREVRHMAPAPTPSFPAPPAPESGLYALHYSCSELAAATDRTPEVSAVVVRQFVTGRQWVFAGFQEAERMGLSPRDIPDRLPALEGPTLRAFFRFAADLARPTWLHWNMNAPSFGFGALAQRYRVVVREDPPDPFGDRQFDLAEYLIRQFGHDFIGHPRLHQLIARNDAGGLRYRDPVASGQAWRAGRYAEVMAATSARVSAVCELYRRLLEGRLRIGDGRLVGLDGPTTAVGEPDPGTVSSDGRVRLAGGWHKFGPQQTALLALILRPDGVDADDAIRQLGLTDGKHLSKLVTDLRSSLRARLRKAPAMLNVHRAGGRLSAAWVRRDTGGDTKELRA